MRLSSDDIILWHHGWFHLNQTILTTWLVMLFLAVGCRLITRRIKIGPQISRWQSVLEIIVITIKEQIEDIGLPHAEKYLGYLGTLFLFILTSNVLTILPGYDPPTGSLSTTAALALTVFIAVPFYGIMERGFVGYLKSYVEPTFILLPINIITEFTHTLALAIRLFGNIMSGTMILGILLIITPLFFPMVMTALGLLIGVIQAYIFGVLATVYIAAAVGENSSTNQNST